MRLLVVTSCTLLKKHLPGFPSGRELTIEDFQELSRLTERERELAAWQLPAGRLYTGPQHIQLMAGVTRLRHHLGPEAVTVNVVSAGYGLVPEDQPLVPYEVTFSTMRPEEIRCWADKLDIPESVRQVVADFPLVIFLLGSRYLEAIRLPLDARKDQRFIFLATQKEAQKPKPPRITVVRAGPQEASAFGAGNVSLKGRMFDLFARAIVRQGPELLDKVHQDNQEHSFLEAIREEVRLDRSCR